MTIQRYSPYLLVLILFVLQGCVATHSFPTVARIGGAITLAVGSPNGMTKLNTMELFVSDVDFFTIGIK